VEEAYKIQYKVADCGAEGTDFRLLKIEQTRVGLIRQIEWSQTWRAVACTGGVQGSFIF
jgi:hypothetical protein